jgi:chromosomal replication initiation ATPase DnaA
MASNAAGPWERAVVELTVGMAAMAVGISTLEIISMNRGDARQIFARHLAMYLAVSGFSLPLGRVGRMFGRDRSTVAYACAQIEDRRDDPVFDMQVSALEAAVREVAEATQVAGAVAHGA